ncbi:putative vacuolar protein sorting-associated protein, partial [Thalictrum thalictroides]
MPLMERKDSRPSSGKLRGAQVNKVVNISGLGIYCRTSIGTIDNVIDPQFFCDGRSDSNKFDNIMVPCDVAVSLVVNRAGQLEDGVPQYSINLEITNLVLQLNEIQLQHILIICDYLGTWPLREKYGRFRPCASTLCMKSEGWQKKWWQYAQKSVLSDIRKRLKKTSWSSLGSRILDRRIYVSFYKKKLNFIQQGQPGQGERNHFKYYLSHNDKEWDNSCNVAVGRHQNVEGTSTGTRGWINWLSLGMLGAGGTEDSMQFSGVVSDEIVKDIYEVTQFHPTSSPEGVGLTKNGLLLFAIKFNVHQISATLLSKTYDKESLQIILDEVNMVFKLWEESWNVYMLVKSMKMDDLCTKKVVLLTKGCSTEEDILMSGTPFITLEVDMSVVNHEPELSVKVVLEPFEVTYESEFLLSLQEFYVVLKSFQFQSERVLSSHNGFEDANVRLLSKAEYILYNRKKIMWDVRLSTIIVSIPWRRESSEYIMVVGVDSLLYQSRKAESSKSASLGPSTICSTPYNDIFLEFQRDDLYDHFKIALTSFEVKVKLPDCCQPISILDKFNASLNLASCIIPNEPTLKQLEVHSSVSPLCVHFSHSIYGALMGMYSCLDIPIVKSEAVIEQPRTSPAFNFRVSADLKSVSFHVDIADEAEKSLVVIFALEDIDSLWDYEEVNGCWFCVKTLKISTSRGENVIHTLCSSRNLCSTYATHQSDTNVGIDFSSDRCGEISGSSDGCFLLLYYPQAVGYQKYGIYLTDLDLHIYPNIVGLLCKFVDQLSGNGTISSARSCKNSVVSHTEIKHTLKKSSLEHQKFGFSNIYEDGSTASEGIPLDYFPFVTMPCSSTRGSLDLSLIHAIPEWSKHFIERDRKRVRNPVLTNRKRFGMCSPPNMKHLPHIDLFPATEESYDGDLCVIDLNLNGIKLYFHDTSCTLGTITLPICKSLLIVQGTRYLDMLFSIDGLLLCSPWATKDFGEFLWGRSLKNLSPILNIRVRKNNGGTENQSLEISFGVQHVRCVLPSEFLSILIGYFSLPDWSSYGYEKVGAESLAEKDNDKCGIIWKIEILDSTLILPVECIKGRSLHLGLQQLYFSFTTVNQKDDAMKDIPLCCIIPAEKFGHSNHILNIFGQGLCLSLAFLNDEEKISAKLDQDSDLANFSLLLPLDIDLWIRIPCDSSPFGGVASSTCIMTNINSCHVVAE